MSFWLLYALFAVGSLPAFLAFLLWFVLERLPGVGIRWIRFLRELDAYREERRRRGGQDSDSTDGDV